MTQRLSSFLILMLAVGCLASCSSTPEVTPTGLICLKGAPIRLKVGTLDVYKQYMPPDTDPHIDHLMNPPPHVIVEQWARDRFQVGTGTGKALLTIENASIVESSVKTTSANPFASSLVKYTGNLAVRLEVIDPSGTKRGYVQTSASASRIIPESATVKEREQVWLVLVEDMINQLDAALEPKIQEYLHDFMG